MPVHSTGRLQRARRSDGRLRDLDMKARGRPPCSRRAIAVVPRQESTGKKSAQDLGQVFGDILGDQPRTESPRCRTMQPDSRASCLERRHGLREKATDDAGENVARACCREPGRQIFRDRRSAGRIRDNCVGSFQEHDGPGQGRGRLRAFELRCRSQMLHMHPQRIRQKIEGLPPIWILAAGPREETCKFPFMWGENGCGSPRL